jgi:integrase/recombinase XerD
MATMSPLRRRMIEDMTVRNLSPATQRSYISAVSKFSRYFGRSPDRLELEEVRAFQVHLVSTGISWPALNQIVCALRFFYGVTLGEALIPERIPYAREPRKLPVVLSADEVVQFLEAVSSLKSRAALTTAYAAGLRASEVAGLRIEDIDSARGVIQVRHGKGAKDRNVMLSHQLLGIAHHGACTRRRGCAGSTANWRCGRSSRAIDHDCRHHSTVRSHFGQEYRNANSRRFTASRTMVQ